MQASHAQTDGTENNSEFSSLPDSDLLMAARQIYQAYYDSNPRLVQRPVGVAINRVNYRGRPLFSDKPILLPQETFVPLNEIESELY